MTFFRTLIKLGHLRHALGITWAEALREGLTGLESYQQLDRQYEAQRDARGLVAGRVGTGEPPAREQVSVHHY